MRVAWRVADAALVHLLMDKKEPRRGARGTKEFRVASGHLEA
jgi:hypothetical protein